MRLCILISLVCVLTAFGSAGPSGPCRTVQPEPGFDPKEVVRQVHTRGDMNGLRSGGSGRVPGRLSNRYPDLSEPGVEQTLDDGEFLIDTSSTLTSAPGCQEDPAMAFDGANFLVVWVDHRGDSYSDICGARVTPQGTVLDPSGFVISQAAYDQQCPSLGFDGANFLVVWQDYRRGYAFNIYGARVTPGGTVLDPSGFVVSWAIDDQRHPAVGFDGANFLVVWQNHRYTVEEPDIYGARVTPQGTVLDSSGFVISQAAHGQFDPALGFGGANFLVVWQDCRDSGYSFICGTRVTPGGTVINPLGFPISGAVGYHTNPAIASDSANYLVAWQDCRGMMPAELSIHGTRVTAGGTVLDPDGIVISQAASYQGTPALAFDGANFLAVWDDLRSGNDLDVYGARVTPEGELLDPSGFAIAQAADDQRFPVLGFDGADFLVAWQDYRNNAEEPDIYGARVTPEGDVLDTNGLVITQTARDQSTPALGFDGSNFLVVWEDSRGGYSDLYGARVAPWGEVLDTGGFVIAQAANDQGFPAVGFDGANFLVVWEDRRGGYSDVYGARVTPGGAVLDTSGFVISQAPDRQGSPVVGFGGAGFLVVWQDYRNGSPDIYGARVTSQGTVLDTSGFVVSQAPDWQCSPALGFDGANLLVVWEDSRDNPGESDIYGARVTPGGAVLDPAGIAITQASRDQLCPALAFDGTNFLVAWESYPGGTYSDIHGTRVTPGGDVLDTNGLVIAQAAKDQSAPALAFDGANFLLVWEDSRDGSPDIFGVRVAPTGVVFDSGSVVRQQGNQYCPELARGTGSQLLLVYQGWAGTVGDKTYNTDRIWGKVNPSPTGIEEGPRPAVYGSRPTATIVRGVLMIGDRGRKTGGRVELLDIAGRKVLDLSPGPNDVRALVPGVYFVRGGAGAEDGTQKVVVQR